MLKKLLWHVNDKTVSKWETGNGLPDVGSLQAISVFFGVSINELLAGERVSAGDYQRKAEETITGLLEQEQKGRKRRDYGMQGCSCSWHIACCRSCMRCSPMFFVYFWSGKMPDSIFYPFQA